MAFPGERSWGYSLTNPFAIEGAYGGANGFKRLIDAAHAQGIAIILDVVYNHFGPDKLDLWQYDGWSENNLVAFTFITIIDRGRPGATTVPTMEGERFVNTFAITPCFGWRNFGLMACALTPLFSSGIRTVTTATRKPIFRKLGPFCNGSTRRCGAFSPAESPLPRI